MSFRHALLGLSFLAAGCPASTTYVPDAPPPGLLDAGRDAARDAPGIVISPDAPRDVGDLPDAGDPCAAIDCDDANACTTDVCVLGTCMHDLTSGACDDGLYCNGDDTCDAGACTVHSGDPCPGASACSEASERCEGCTSAADCPGPTTGSCAYADLCATTATSTDTTWECIAGVCVATDVTTDCARDTEGTSCGSVTTSAPPCDTGSDPCSSDGQHDVTTFTPTCHSGTCVADATTSLEGCTVPSDGNPCGPGCGDWSPCMARGGTGGCFGARVRTCGLGECMAGTCVPRTVRESEDCAFPDGTPCEGALPESCDDCLPSTPCGGSGCGQACIALERSECIDGTCRGAGAPVPLCMPCACP